MITIERDGIKISENFTAYSILMVSQSSGCSTYCELIYFSINYIEKMVRVYIPITLLPYVVFEITGAFDDIVDSM